MDRRALLGMSVAELVMARIGHLSGALCLLFVLPILPYLVGLGLIGRVTEALETGDTAPYRPQYRPDRND